MEAHLHHTIPISRVRVLQQALRRRSRRRQLRLALQQPFRRRARRRQLRRAAGVVLRLFEKNVH